MNYIQIIMITVPSIMFGIICISFGFTYCKCEIHNIENIDERLESGESAETPRLVINVD